MYWGPSAYVLSNYLFVFLYRDHLLPDRGRETAQPPMDPKDLYRLDERPNSAPDFRWNPSLSSGAPRPSTAHGYRSTDIKTRLSYSSKNIHHPSPRSRSQPNRPISAKAYQPLIAGKYYFPACKSALCLVLIWTPGGEWLYP